MNIDTLVIFLQKEIEKAKEDVARNNESNCDPCYVTGFDYGWLCGLEAIDKYIQAQQENPNDS